MAVTLTVSTNGSYEVYSSVNATLATAISEVTNELEEHHCSIGNTQFVFTFDDNLNQYVFMAVVKKH
jgi:hypothetical protein